MASAVLESGHAGSGLAAFFPSSLPGDSEASSREFPLARHPRVRKSVLNRRNVEEGQKLPSSSFIYLREPWRDLAKCLSEDILSRMNQL
jgi:hypothetical protein